MWLEDALVAFGNSEPPDDLSQHLDRAVSLMGDQHGMILNLVFSQPCFGGSFPMVSSAVAHYPPERPVVLWCYWPIYRMVS